MQTLKATLPQSSITKVHCYNMQKIETHTACVAKFLLPLGANLDHS